MNRLLPLLLIPLLLQLPASPAQALRQIELVDVVPAGQPLAVAIDPQGRLFVPQANGTVTVATPQGEVLQTFGGKPGRGEALTVRPVGVAFLDQRILVLDRELCRIAVFDRDGKFLGSYGRSGDGLKEFDEPSAIAVFGNLIYVADTGNDRIQVLGPNGVLVGVIGRRGSDDALLRQPLAMAVDPRGLVHVIDGKAGQVKSYDSNGEYLGKFPAAEQPTAIAADAEGIVLLEQRPFKVGKYDFQGRPLFSFGSRGADRSQFRSLDAVALDPSGRLAVADRGKGNLQLFASAATDPLPTSEHTPPPTSVTVVGDLAGLAARRIAVDKNDNLYAVLPKTETVAVLHDGKVVRSIAQPKWKPVAAAVDGDGALWVIDGRKEQILKFDPAGQLLMTFGASGSREGYLSEPSALLVSPEGLIYVADTDNARVQVFNGAGTFLKVIGGAKNGMGKPVDLALGPGEVLLVLDAERRSVRVFSLDGDALAEFGQRGEPHARLQRPLALTANESEVLVLDGGSGTIKVYDAAGNYLREFGAPGRGSSDLAEPTALVASGATDLLVADPGSERIVHYRFCYTPQAPAGVSAKPGMRRVTLSWEALPQSYVEEYRIYRRDPTAKGYRLLAQQRATVLTDSDVRPNLDYRYRVSAVARQGNESRLSAEAGATPLKTVPAAPGGLKAAPQEWSVDLSWDANPEPFVDHYRVYRQTGTAPLLLGETRETFFADPSLDPEREYTFQLAAVSIDDEESPRSETTFATPPATRPPLELAVVELAEIFSNSYKIYETEGLGTVRLSNNTRDALSKIKLVFAVKDYMDFPAEVEVTLGPRETKEIPLKAIFNNQLLTLTEDTAIQSSLTASYYRNQELKSFSLNHPLKVFEKHRITWDVSARFAAFVTPKDPVILEYGRAVVTQFGDVADPLLHAGMLFDALGMHGLTYLQDPSNPYQETSGTTDFVDYLQYPRETLQRKSGDCDDLVGLYAALLESIGLRTMTVAVPGHMFLIFSPGYLPGTAPDGLADLFVEHDGTLWVPVEVTRVGSPFMQAWESGVKSYRLWTGKGLTLMDIRQAWEQFKPASLPASDWRAPQTSRSEIEAKFRDELAVLRKIRVRNLARPYLARLKTQPDDTGAMLQLAIVNAKAGELTDAADLLAKAVVLQPDSAAIHNTLGNVHLLAERYAEAAVAYTKAAGLDPGDALVWVNLARAYQRLDKKDEAVSAFKQALNLDPELLNRYREMAIALGTF